jgi:uncharacterized Zn-finger protein
MPYKKRDEPQACLTQQVEITASDLPLSCPPTNYRIWDAHPRVYLSIEYDKQVVCPYCATKYILNEAAHS